MTFAPVRTFIIGAAAIAALSGQATAQQRVLTSPQEIGRCLCQEIAIADLKQKNDAGKAAVDREKAAIDMMDRDLAQQKARVDPNNATSVEVFKTLLDQRDAKWDNLKNVIEMSYLEANDRYNTAVLGFQASCGGTMYDMNALAIARSNLVCPK
ncbi:MAG: hypothetical protein NTY59_03355 [Alphaproteobacteria bacterium]|nr:hypothetical protein [Alphaproteobacteria bacterium]